MHLRAPEQIADLALREVLQVPEPQQLPVAVVQVGFELGESTRASLAPSPARSSARPFARQGLVERVRLVAVPDHGRLEHILDGQAEMIGDVLCRGLAPQLLTQGVADVRERQTELLNLSRRLDGPGAVPEVPAKLAQDRRHRVRAELDAAIGIPSAGRLDQPEPRDLDEVVERLGRVPVPRRELVGEWQVPLGELFGRHRRGSACGRARRCALRARRGRDASVARTRSSNGLERGRVGTDWGRGSGIALPPLDKTPNPDIRRRPLSRPTMPIRAYDTATPPKLVVSPEALPEPPRGQPQEDGILTTCGCETDVDAWITTAARPYASPWPIRSWG